jgi:hypothetical protein
LLSRKTKKNENTHLSYLWLLSGAIGDQQEEGGRLRLREQGVSVLLPGMHGSIHLGAWPISSRGKRFNRVPSLFSRKTVKVGDED